ncbi:unnamed protein product [Symbiodinium microadriaticum]|nr:unnamed protein product [Symbiodinium microadriaticum]
MVANRVRTLLAGVGERAGSQLPRGRSGPVATAAVARGAKRTRGMKDVILGSAVEENEDYMTIRTNDTDGPGQMVEAAEGEKSINPDIAVGGGTPEAKITDDEVNGVMIARSTPLETLTITVSRGMSHFGDGGFKGNLQEGSFSGQGGQGRPSERLTFHADYAEDLGGSARSYLRQIKSLRRMTLLPCEQQALVLYQNLGGKAWVAAEELSVAKLGSAGGVQYFVSWITARFLDLEVAHIGKGFSDFFRRCRRKNGQSIREYSTEYDLHGLSDSEDEGEINDDMPDKAGLPHLPAVKNKYKDRARSRGYQAGNKDEGGDRDPRKDPNGATREERLKKLKSKSFCVSCGRKGHWHKDVECPNYKGAGGDDKAIRAVEVCYHVPAEVMSLTCAKSVAGTAWLQRYTDLVAEIGEKVDLIKECEAFRFGAGKIHYSAFHVRIKFLLGTKLVSLKVSVINGETTSGHPAIPIRPAKAGEGEGELPLADSGLATAEQYTAFVLSDYIPTAPKPYKIFYDKKLSPEVKQMLTQHHLSETAFLASWNNTNIDSDFWVEGEFASHRIHATSSLTCRPPAISRMTKVELLAEANRIGVLVHHRWTNEEIKAAIQEHRMENDPSTVMKSITKLTFDELKVKATRLGVSYGDRITKGNLIRLIRFEFGEIPSTYREWASKEIRISATPHPELVRFARWFDAKNAKETYGNQEFIEENGSLLFPTSLSGAASSTGPMRTVGWSVVEGTPIKADCHQEKEREGGPGLAPKHLKVVRAQVFREAGRFEHARPHGLPGGGPTPTGRPCTKRTNVVWQKETEETAAGALSDEAENDMRRAWWNNEETSWYENQGTWGSYKASPSKTTPVEILPDYIQGWMLLTDAGLDIQERNAIQTALRGEFSVQSVATELRAQWPDQELQKRDRNRKHASFISDNLQKIPKVLQGWSKLFAIPSLGVLVHRQRWPVQQPKAWKVEQAPFICFVSDGKAVVDGGATKTVAASRPWNVDHAERPVFAFGNSSQDQCLSMAQIKVTVGDAPGHLKVHAPDKGQ